MWQVWIELDEWVFWGEYDAKWKAEDVLDMVGVTYPNRATQVRYVA